MNFSKKTDCGYDITYWEKFYENYQFDQTMIQPSQFAVFSLSEMLKNNVSAVTDVGCGNGRDSLFFLQNHLSVIAMDGCVSAIKKAKELCGGYDGFQCMPHDISKKFPQVVKNIKETKAFYARFLLHAIPDETVVLFMKNCASVMGGMDMLFLEYRTEKDIQRTKVTESHYRNFIPPDKIREIASKNDLDIQFQTEGTGFAKWKQDDAFVARQVFIRR